MKISRHYLGLGFAIALGTLLRFWNLNLKPLWLDEVISALFALGRNYKDVPLDVLLPIAAFKQIFTFNLGVSCPQIAHNLATYSTHPPLFFCLMHSWVGADLIRQPGELSTVLRSLPALFGVSAIAAIYVLNRIAFSKPAGLIAALFMAVSPFGVYLSQEARHYTLPVLLITLALLALVQIQQDIKKQQLRPFIWLAWVIINSIGFYTHYFFILTFLAQIITLFGLFYKTKATVDPTYTNNQKLTTYPLHPLQILLLTVSCLLPFIFFIPWLSILLGDVGSPDTNWIPQPHNIAPFYQTLAAWLLMAIALPVENQPLWIAIPAGVLMLLFGIWLGWYLYKGLKQVWQTKNTHWATWTLLSFTLCVLFQFFGIVYILGKDITVAPRYSFVYYPAICAIVGASLSQKLKIKKAILNLRNRFLIVSLVGFISCIFVVYSLAFQKPYNPQQVAKNMNLEPGVPLAAVMGYNDYQDVALGLSFALALDKLRTPTIKSQTYWAFYKRSQGYESVWQSISKIRPPASKLNLWVISPGLKRRDYPPQLSLSSQTTCTIDPNEHHRIGIPYQLYRCVGNG